MFYTLIKQVFDQSERTQGSIYIIMLNTIIIYSTNNTLAMSICRSNCEAEKLTNVVVGPPTKNKKLTLLCFFVFCASLKFSGVSATVVNFVVG